MRPFALAFLLLTSVSGWAASPPDASSYTVNVHVSASEMLFDGNGNAGMSQILHVVIDGKNTNCTAQA